LVGQGESRGGITDSERHGLGIGWQSNLGRAGATPAAAHSSLREGPQGG
jgi:hypothetical protein